jgi:hypothetical protein
MVISRVRDFPECLDLPPIPSLLSVTNLPVMHDFDELCAFAELRAPAQAVSFARFAACGLALAPCHISWRIDASAKPQAAGWDIATSAVSLRFVPNLAPLQARDSSEQAKNALGNTDKESNGSVESACFTRSPGSSGRRSQ